MLALAQRGLTNPAIAAELGITENAVRYHLKELHRKLATAGDRGRLSRIGWLGAGTIFGWKASAAPLAAAGFVVAASAAGFWAVHSAHESSAEGQDATGTTHCVYSSASIPPRTAGTMARKNRAVATSRPVPEMANAAR